ncbi:MAG: trehalose-phosphatase [Hyphomicrobium sp.]|nr:MAG: trehalose-phosphatase [Hyphomicrobium sp.]PPD00333.1 MAG: trehalose-phosphatase [Hyphomicrobium sp.]
MRSEPPFPFNLQNFSFFLDIDGTLAEIARLPELAVVSPETQNILALLFKITDGALAVVSGRQLDDIDRMIGLPFLPAAGIHGAQLRLPGKPILLNDSCTAELDDVHIRLREGLHDVEGILWERKPLSVAIHYRAIPNESQRIIALAHQVVKNRPGLKVITGKMIVEILPASSDKGQAVTQLMSYPPFKGRTPFFAGDDTTDEDAFIAINSMDGISAKIGSGPSIAKFGFENSEALRAWLARLITAV